MGPLIGITCKLAEDQTEWFVPRPYVEAVEAAGGVPVLLAPPGPDVEVEGPPGGEPGPALAERVRALLDRLDGLLLTGGGDVDPAWFGQPEREKPRLKQPLRDRFEIPLVREALGRDMPVLGICRGHQVLNIAAGGDIYQDVRLAVPAPLDHWQSGEKAAHGVALAPGSRLAGILGGTEWMTNSVHHQSVGRIAPGFTACGLAPDGIVEAIEAPGLRFAVGVQWHPELLWRAAPEQARLFAAFVDAAARAARSA